MKSEARKPRARAFKMTAKKLALIHIVKKELAISDGDYKGILNQVAGVDSAKDLDEAGFRKLMSFFVHSKYYRVNAFGMTLKQKLYVLLLARRLRWDTAHLANFIHKYYHKAGLNELTRKEASHLIESLKAIRERGRPAGAKMR